VIDFDRLRNFDASGFIDAHRKELIIVCAVFFSLLVILFAVECGASGSAKREAARRSAALKARAITPDELMFPPEPLSVPGILRFREPHVVWSAEEAKKWYTVPDVKTLGSLRSAGRKKVDGLLESVP
jgi:hypothetical protein